MAQELPEEFRMKDLFIDVKLEACVNGSTYDFLGRKLFSSEFYRKNVGFGITSIDIEINTSLQPLVVVTFKDLYGNTVFGTQERDGSGPGNQSIDYSVLFNWPPPKFLFSFKGYLGKPASWVLNLKRTTTSFNSSDGSYDIKCEFVPNQWGFFADMPFLYLLAAKRLRKDRIGVNTNADGAPLTASQEQDQLKSVISVFDLIKIGKQVEIKTQDTTKEFDDLVKQLGSIKSNVSGAIVTTNILGQGEEITGEANNQPTKDFTAIRIPRIDELPDARLSSIEQIEQHLGIPQNVQALNAYITLGLFYRPPGGAIYQTGFQRFGTGVPSDWPTFLKEYNNSGSETQQAIETARAQAISVITTNLQKVDEEIRRRVFSTSESKLEKITIGEIFSQLAKDSAFVMGSILDAGLEGYRGTDDRMAARDRLVEEGKLIGESFPLVIVEGEELPATNENLPDVEGIGVDEHEMDFVRRFISAISEGIAKDLLANNEQNGQDDSILKQRINNMEIAEENPYKPYYQNIATNILIRAGVAAFFTRSDDPNLPGDYDTTFGGDRDDIQSIEELADRDMQNLTESIIKNLSDIDFLLLKRFATFFSRYFTKDAQYLATASGGEGQLIGTDGFNPFNVVSVVGEVFTQATAPQPGVNPLDWRVVMSNVDPRNIDLEGIPISVVNQAASIGSPLDAINTLDQSTIDLLETKGIETLTFRRIWNELYQPSLLSNYQILNEDLVYGDVDETESKREDQILAQEGTAEPIFTTDTNQAGIRNAQNPLSFVDPVSFTATRIINNGLAYMYPDGSSTSNSYFMVFFQGEANKRAQEANSAPTDMEFKNEDKDATDLGKNEVLGYVPINAKYGDDGDATQEVDNGKYMLNRIATLMGYRDGTTFGAGDTIFSHFGCKNPPSSFYGKASDSDLDVRQTIKQELIWNKSIKENPQDNPTDATDYVVPGNIGYTVCSHQGSDEDSGFVFGLFNPGPGLSGRNQRAYIRKCAEVINDKINKIVDERNQIIGEVLGKAGESEELIYKQMHTLFHQWQTLAYKDEKDGNGCLVGSVDENRDGENKFDVASVLEKRFGGNHKDLLADEKVCFSQTEIAEGAALTEEEIQSLEENEEGLLCLSLSNQTQSAGIPDGTFIYDYPLQRITRPANKKPINVRDSIVNLEPLYKPNANTSVLNIIQQVCSKNNFLFIPIPGNPGYLDVREIYLPSRELANIAIRNFFHVLFTPTPESRTKTRNVDGTPLSLSENHRTYNANSFVIRYGHPDNQIVSNIQVGTDDNKVTAESIINLQRLVDNENQNKKVTTDCSMLPVLAGRSYKASVDMLGNSQAYPMQFFYLENSPLFGGLYQIMKVKHQIDPNNMTTSLEGIRMRFASGSYGSIEPITLQTFRELGPSEAPLALSEGFDKAEREELAKYREGIPSPGTTTLTANLGDYIDSDFVDGENGGPVAQPVAQLSPSILNSFDTSLGARELWVAGKKVGTSQMYIYDAYPMTAEVVSAFKVMQEAAIADGIDLHVISGYRDPFNNIKDQKGRHISSSQYSLRISNAPKSKKNNEDFLLNAGSGNFSPATARPGYSNHNSGKAIDLNCYGEKLRSPFNQEIYEWLLLNAYKYGFVRTVSSEEWHWEYRPGTPMFGYSSKMNRNGSKWYGLPDKLGIPLNQPEGGLASVEDANDTLNSSQKALVDKIVATANQAGIKDKNRLLCLLVVARAESNLSVGEENLNLGLNEVKARFAPHIVGVSDETLLNNYIPKNRVPANINPKNGTQKKLADLVYGGRKGNSTTEGYKYRGRGLSNIRFKSNYNALSNHINTYLGTSVDLASNPDLLLQENGAVAALVAGHLAQQFGPFSSGQDFLNSAEDIHNSNLDGESPSLSFVQTKNSYDQLRNDSYVIQKLEQFPDYA